MTLIGLTYLVSHRPRGLPNFDNVDLTSPNHALIGWRIVIRGPRVIFIGPPKVPKGLPRIYVIPRQHFAEWWEGDEADVGKIDVWPPQEQGKEKR